MIRKINNKTMENKFKKGDIITLKKDTPKHIIDNCPKEMILVNQGTNKDFWNCYNLNKQIYYGSIHISFMLKRSQKEQLKN